MRFIFVPFSVFVYLLLFLSLQKYMTLKPIWQVGSGEVAGLQVKSCRFYRRTPCPSGRLPRPWKCRLNRNSALLARGPGEFAAGEKVEMEVRNFLSCVAA